MGPIEAFWQFVNFFAPAVGVALIAGSFAKLLWWRELAAIAWLRLVAWAGVASALVSVGGLLVFGHDGKMATYAAMVVTCALALWWVGFGPRRR